MLTMQRSSYSHHQTSAKTVTTSNPLSSGGRAGRLANARIHWGCGRLATRLRPAGAKSFGESVQTANVPGVRDKFVAKLVQTCVPDGGPKELEQLRESCLSVLPSLYMPTTRNEDYRFTDISPILKSEIQVPAANEASVPLERSDLSDNPSNKVVIVNGIVDWEASRLNLPEGAFVGKAEDAPSAIDLLGHLSSKRGGPFAVLNGAIVKDAIIMHLKPGIKMQEPIHLLYYSSGSSSGVPVSAPRVLAVCEENSSLELVEEYRSQDYESSKHITLSVVEIFARVNSQVVHKYIQLEDRESMHMKGTLVSQEKGSKYELTEARIGGMLTRHDIGINQEGPETESIMSHFLSCGEQQLQDLHSRLILSHPQGTADQLHKCIVTHASGKGVFDGNVKVNRYAQKTDAGQLSRNLLVVPRATVNVKPNLQIVADDVKCTHGCAVSDLSEEEIFYFRARGIDVETARRALVYSFGAEVVQKLGHKHLEERIQFMLEKTLENVGMS